MALAALAVLSGGASGEETHRLSGTLTQPAVDDGTPGYLKLIGTDEACTDPGPGRYAGQASFSEGEARYTLEDVAAGTYTACLFIDSDDNVVETQSPTSGDYAAMKPVTVDGDTTLDVNELEWFRIP
jgi:hypothetical protein